MPDASRSRPEAGPTLRTLAAQAGVTSMTVSLALRDHPSISVATRTRLKKLAAAKGYRPDPAITKLMHHLRTRRGQRVRSTLCALCLKPRVATAPGGYDYMREVLGGARRRADSLGFGLDLMAIDEEGLTPRRLQRILLSRGIDGVVLLPMSTPVRLASLLDWSLFAAVAATSSVLTPRLNTAIPDQFGNMLRLCRSLAERGLRRLGLVTLHEQDVRVDHRVMAVFGWHSQFGGGEAIPPFVMERREPDMSSLVAWVGQHQPDTIISDSEIDLDRIAALLRPAERRRITWASTSLLPELARYPGIDEKASEVGAAAVEVLAAMIQRGERGLPVSPRTTLIAGEFFAPRGSRRKTKATDSLA